MTLLSQRSILIIAFVTICLKATQASDAGSSVLHLGESVLEAADATSLEIDFNAASTLVDKTERKHTPVKRGAGGVAFVSSAEAQFITVELRYNPDRPDGKRIVVRTWQNGVEADATLDAYDWEAIPTANFVASPWNAAVTIFGGLKDKKRERDALSQGARIINYHPAFENTLAGLRLFQLDTLYFSKESEHLPVLVSTGEIVKGPGETLSDLQKNIEAEEKLWIEMTDFLEQNRWFSRTYIIGDFGPKVRAFITNGTAGEVNVALTGDFWWALFGTNEPFYDLPPGVYSKRQPGENSRPGDLHYRNYISREISAFMNNWNGGNPTVYDSSRRIMRLAAYFRHVKDRNPTTFEAFLLSFRNTKLEPSFKTPNIWIESEWTRINPSPF